MNVSALRLAWACLMLVTLSETVSAQAPVAGPPQAQTRELTVLAVPGPTTSALRGLLRAFTAATSVPVADADWDGSIEQVRARRDYDLALLRGDVLLTACDEGLLERVDWSAVGGRDHYVAAATSDCGVGAAVSTTVLAWDRDKFQGTPAWSDFWDVAKYPGRRALRRGARGNLEAALLADGVGAADVYRQLRSNEGVDRAFRKLDQLRPYIVWWETEEQAVKLIAANEVLMGSAPAAGVLAGNREGRRFGIQWMGALVEVESWAVPKGAAQGRLAAQVIYFAGVPALQAHVLTATGVAGLAKGGSDGAAPEAVAASAANPSVMAGALMADEGFWRENADKLNQRFAAWLAR